MSPTRRDARTRPHPSSSCSREGWAEDAGATLEAPVFHLDIGDRLEVARVAGDDREAADDSRGGDPAVMGAQPLDGGRPGTKSLRPACKEGAENPEGRAASSTTGRMPVVLAGSPRHGLGLDRRALPTDPEAVLLPRRLGARGCGAMRTAAGLKSSRVPSGTGCMCRCPEGTRVTRPPDLSSSAHLPRGGRPSLFE